MKKSFLLFVFILLIPNEILVGREKQANIRDNWISGEISFIGAGLRYERMLNRNFSLGVDLFANMLLVLVNAGSDLNIRYYPWGRTFFAGLGIGYHWCAIVAPILYTPEYPLGFTGLGLTPEIGWKIFSSTWHKNPGYI